MATRLIAAVLLLTLLNACASQRVVRLDTGLELRLAQQDLRGVLREAVALHEGMPPAVESRQGAGSTFRFRLPRVLSPNA